MNSWGNFPKVDTRAFPFRSEADLRGLLTGKDSVIAYGLGRSYGDSALSRNQIVTRCYNRLLGFNQDTGLVVCESGVRIADIVETFVPRGWFPSVTPGTKFITVGGAIASDVHGKNHHKEGCFSNRVAWLKMMLADGRVITASPEENRDVFFATCGGMGLTGIILEAGFFLKRIENPWIRQHSRRLGDLKEVMEAFEESENATYSVAWIDCVKKGKSAGRSILMTGEHAGQGEVDHLDVQGEGREVSVPFFLPGWILNPLTVRAFNTFYYQRARQEAHEFVSLDKFFYPLDSVGNWNRIYGRRGFLQYQFVLPREAGYKGLGDVFRVITKSGQGSFLAVLKLLGKENESMLGFPKEGWTLALDFPVNREIFRLLDYLDDLVLEYGGRFYLTKDARMKAATFEKCFPRLHDFRKVKDQLDPKGVFGSHQSKRLGLT